eukprot:COSAG04_NODE_4829_length_1876_cov_1.514350_1_plen_82_part_00
MTLRQIPIRYAVSHACEDEDQMVEEVVVCEDATLRYVTNTHARIEWADGRTEEHDLSSCDRHLSLRLTYLHVPTEWWWGFT